MPCENCNAQFTVFKRKKSCLECRRLYCSNCLVKQKEIVFCHKCIIFRRRPLTKIELLKLKSKDLIFYLQSKHISTTGCVEKEELVNLVLSHIHSTNYNTDNLRSPNSSYSSSSSRSQQTNDLPHTFDSIKQTCQNLFTSFTDKITTEINFDINKINTPNQQQQKQQQNIFSQPRGNLYPPEKVFDRNVNSNTSTHQQQSSNYNDEPTSFNNSSQFSSPKSNNSTNGSTTTSPTLTTTNINRINSIFSNNHSPTTSSTNDHISYAGIPSTSNTNNIIEQPSTSGQNNHNINNNNSSNLNILRGFRPTPTSTTSNIRHESDSSTSSFEELGAIGGTSNMDNNWHFIQKNSMNDNVLDSSLIKNNAVNKKKKLKIFNRNLQQINCVGILSTNSANNINITPSMYGDDDYGNKSSSQNQSTSTNQQHQRLIRRRSDTFIIMNQNNLFDNINDIDFLETSRSKRSKKCCNECGIGLKKHVSKFRHQLETSNLTESEKNLRVADFLHSLENKCTMDKFDNDLTLNNIIGGNNLNDSSDVSSIGGNDETDHFTNENDGINVYPTISFMYDEQGGTDEEGVILKSKLRGRLKLKDISSRSDLEELSVKQLKEILMLNRVDFKGCCEKTELLQRVYRLWKDHMATPAVEKLTTEDLCKICMDAPIECVILECGHMVTCTSCGKVLNECPICRQYIVRVVRFFRA